MLCEVAVMGIKGYYIVSTLKLANPCEAQVKAATISVWIDLPSPADAGYSRNGLHVSIDKT